MKIARITPLKSPMAVSVKVPGSKSYSLRALMIAALSDRPVEIKNLLRSADTDAMRNSLKALNTKRTEINADESGLTARFMTALACLRSGAQIIDGAKSLQKRPVKDLVDALRQLGADIEYMGKDGFLPVKVNSSALTGKQVTIKGDISSQYLSALLLIAPKLSDGLAITVKGEQISKPYIDMTLDIMSYFSVRAENHHYKKYIIKPQPYTARKYRIESDYSSAGYFFALAALTKSKITVDNLNPDSKQADINFLPILKKMGADVQKNADSVTVTGHNLAPIKVNMNNCPDQAMTVAVLAAFASGKTVITNIGSLRIKETERILALQNELAKMEINTESTIDSLTVSGGNPLPANIDTYGDHRMAMAFAVAAAKLAGLTIYNPDAVNKTFPDFFNNLANITPVDLKNTNYTNIVLTGMRGTGKSTVGKMVAERLGMKFIDVDKHLEKENSLNIKNAVRANGWEYFRQLESEAIEKLSQRKNTLISTGAGAILLDENVRLLRNNNLVFMLKAEPKTLASRISRYNKLPALTSHKSVYDELSEVWKDRKAKYFASCDFIIETENLSPEDVAREIIGKLK